MASDSKYFVNRSKFYFSLNYVNEVNFSKYGLLSQPMSLNITFSQ